MITDQAELGWHAALDALPEMAWLADANGSVVFLNHAVCDYTGLDATHALGPDAQQLVHPDDRAAAQAAWHSSVAARTPFAHTLRLRNREGAYNWFVVRGRPVAVHGDASGGWSGTAINVDRRRQAEQQRSSLSRDLELERARLRSIVDNVPVGLVFADGPAGTIVGGNAQAEQILGHALLPSPDVEAYSEWSGYHADGRRFESNEYPLARALRGELSVEEIHYRRGDGNMVWIRVSGAPLRDAAGTITGGVIMILDIDADKRARDEQATLLRSEQTARGEAEAAVGERDALIASITHDLKNPLTVIRGQVEMLRRKAPDMAVEAKQEMTRRLGQIDQTVQRMVTQIDELIDVARLRAGQTLDLQHKPVDLADLVRRVTSAFAATTALQEIVFEPGVEQLMGVWDENRLERVFSNLLSNAIKYSPNGGIIVVRVELEQHQQGRWALVTVRDQGIGIPSADLPNIFDLFTRSDAHAGSYAGAGIGLANARNIVQQHGGTIEVSSTEGSGSTFVVRLPLPNDE